MVEVYYISCLSFKFGEHITVSKKKINYMVEYGK